MQILHSFRGSIQQYVEEIPDPHRYRPDSCPQCQAGCPLIAHGFYRRTLVDVAFAGVIRVRRYLCRLCKRTISLLPDFALPYLRFSLSVISLFLVARLLAGRTLRAAAGVAVQPNMPYQRGQFWIRRFQKQVVALCTALANLTAVMPSTDFLTRALHMLEAIGWTAAHRFLFAQLRIHLLGWPRFLIPYGCRVSFPAAGPSPGS
jgi:transposase-like protein